MLRSSYAPPLTEMFSVRRVDGLKPIGIVSCGYPACGLLGVLPMIAMTGSLGWLGSELVKFIMLSIAVCQAALRAGRFARYWTSFVPPGVTSARDSLRWVALPYFSACWASA